MTSRTVLVPLAFLMQGLFSVSYAAISPDQILKETGMGGGLIVHIGGDTGLTAALRKNERFVVHGLVASRKEAEKARKALLAKGLYGPISVAVLKEERLPYGDNVVNLLVYEGVSGAGAAEAGKRRVSAEEIVRVLAPGGLAVVPEDWRLPAADKIIPRGKLKGDRGPPRPRGEREAAASLRDEEYIIYMKPVPSGQDVWTHYLHGADGNAVSVDTKIEPPRRLQWVEEPNWPRSHEHTPTIPAMVSKDNRIYYFFDEGITGIRDLRLPERWRLHARDAYNGLLLWRLPLKKWGPKTWKNPAHWHIPMSAPRRLVAGGKHLYATLDYRGPVHKIDPRTGKVVTVFEDTGNTEEILYCDNMLIVRQRRTIPDYHKKAGPWGVQVREESDIAGGAAGDEKVLGVNTDTGEVIWRREEKRIVTLSLAASEKRVFYHTFDSIVCVGRRTGEKIWANENACWPDYTGTSGTLLVHGDVVYYAADRGVFAWEVERGKQLWRGPRIVRSGIRHPPDLFVANGLLWGGFTPEMPTGRIPKEWSPFAVPSMSGKAVQGMDPLSGEVRRSLDVENLVTGGHHVRCYRGRATESFLLWTKRGIEFVDIDEGTNHERCNWFRGECSYGVMPANGIIYVPPHPCMCSLGAALNGFNALVGGGSKESTFRQRETATLEKGPAYREARSQESGGSADRGWPTYRADGARSGAIEAHVSTELMRAWVAEIGGRLSAVTCTGGEVFVAQVDAHTVHALDAATGKKIWHYTTGARVDSPPTVYKGTVLFGGRDGWVYCLRAGDGRLVWRLQAAPGERMIMVKGQLESAWPVPGSILIQNDIAYFPCGRSSFLDGGITLYGVNPTTGEVVYESELDGPWPGLEESAGKTYAIDGARADILSSDGRNIYMGFNTFDLDLTQQKTPATTDAGLRPVKVHLMPGAGFLDAAWFDRVYWIYGDKWLGRFFKSNIPRSGQILSFNDRMTYSLKGFPKQHFMSPSFTPGKGYLLQADANIFRDKKSGRRGKAAPVKKWAVSSNVRAKGFMLADDTLFLAGAPDLIPTADPYAALDGRRGAVLQAVSTERGKVLREYRLEAEPVFDGMSAAEQRLYISLTNGKLVCYWGRGSEGSGE